MAKLGSIKHYRQAGSAKAPASLPHGELAVAKDGTLYAGSEAGAPVEQATRAGLDALQSGITGGSVVAAKAKAAETAARATSADTATSAARATSADTATSAENAAKVGGYAPGTLLRVASWDAATGVLHTVSG